MNLYQKAKKFIPAGVNSPVRAFKAVGGDPIFAKKGKGPYFWDENGKRYLDFCGSWGALLFGHAPAGLIAAVRSAIADGTSFGIATRKEVELAENIQSFFPSMAMMRLVSSGTEAVMSAIRLARGFTGRNKILKIDGGYHGHVDSLLVKAGSGGATFGVPDSAGIPDALARETLTTPFNDIRSLEKIFRKYGKEIAAFILEPVPANMGVVPPAPGYLEACREYTQRYGALLIFDEVISGFRISPGGAQQYYEIRPDLTCLGKILGSGFPIAAFGGRRDIMQKLSPLGPIYQAGTLSGNPVAVSAALWTLRQFQHAKGARLLRGAEEPGTFWFYEEIRSQIKRKKLPIQLNTAGSMFTLFFSSKPVTDFASAQKSDTKRFAKFFHACLKKGIYLSPSQFEADFISTVHTSVLLQKALAVFLKNLQ